LNSVSRGQSGEIKELTKLVADSGPLLLDGEFNSPPPPPETPGEKMKKRRTLPSTLRTSALLLLLILLLFFQSPRSPVPAYSANPTISLYTYREKTDDWVQTDWCKVGAKIEIKGSGFPSELPVVIHLSQQPALIGNVLTDKIKIYEDLGVHATDHEGKFTAIFVMPQILSDGSGDAEIEYGTYYLYFADNLTKEIIHIVPITAFVQEIRVTPEEGHIGDSLVLEGDGFSSNEPIVIYFSADIASINELALTKLTSFELLGTPVADASGEMVNVPLRVPGELTGGSSTKAVHSGTYFLYATEFWDKRKILAIARFNVLIPSIELSVNEGTVNTEVTINGTGFGNYQNITVSFDDNPLNLASGAGVTDHAGRFTCKVIIPASTLGDHVIKVSDTTGYQGEARFTVVLKPAILLKPDSATVGAEIEISGEKFSPAQKIAVRYDDKPVKIAGGNNITDDKGTCTFSITIPASTGGNHQITASDESGYKASATFRVTPRITVAQISKLAADPNTYYVRITGTGFVKDEAITITFNHKEMYSRSDSAGELRFNFTASADSLTGNSKIIARGSKSGSAETLLNLSDVPGAPAEKASIKLSPATDYTSPGHVGMKVTVSGAGFLSNAEISLTYSDNSNVLALGTVTSDKTGLFSASFTVPPGTAGPHKITATDKTNNAEALFIMEADPPARPTLLTQKPGTIAAEGIYFDWNDSQDLSGVSYHFQISTSQNFSAIAFQRQGLSESEYLLTEKDLTLREKTPYFWRVKAVDGAGNESGWTPGKPVELIPSKSPASDWPRYGLYGLGALIFGGVLYLVIRRVR